MSDADFEIPESMQSIVDVRNIAADLSYARWMLDVTRGKVTEEEEAIYERPQATDFTQTDAKQMVEKALAWMFADKDTGGLLPKAYFQGIAIELGKAARLGERLTGLDIATVKTVIASLEEKREVLEASLTELQIDDGPKLQGTRNDERLMSYAMKALTDLIISGNEGFKDVVFSGFVEGNWERIFDGV